MESMFSLALLLFIVMDPPGNLVTINSMMSGVPSKQRRAVVLRESIIATVILLIVAFGGGALVDALGISDRSISISGGIVLFMIAMGMLFPAHNVLDDSVDGLPLIVPIAMPLIAGPSTISMVILFSQEHALSTVCGAVGLASLGSFLVLYASPKLFEFFGERGSAALERLMGMLLIIISVQMVLNGLEAYLPEEVLQQALEKK